MFRRFQYTVKKYNKKAGSQSANKTPVKFTLYCKNVQ